jgi:hypothetical protein
MWMIDEEDQNLECHADSVECTSRQSCAALSDHAYGDVEPRKKYPVSECQVLQNADQATIMCRVTDRITCVTRKLRQCVDWSGARFGVNHARSHNNLCHVLPLSQE